MASINCENCGKEISSEAAACPQCGHPNKVQPAPAPAPRRGMGCGTGLLLIVGLLFLGFVFNMAMNPPTPTETTPKAASTVREPSEKEQAIAAINLTKLNWTKGGFDNVMLLDTVVQNNGTRDVKDVKIECVNFTKSQTQIGSNIKTIFEIW